MPSVLLCGRFRACHPGKEAKAKAGPCLTTRDRSQVSRPICFHKKGNSLLGGGQGTETQEGDFRVACHH